jgi:hemerythrin superfamily protein
LDHWHVISNKLRKAMKGWGQNLDSYQRRTKQELMSRISMLDEWSDNRDLSQSEWEERYSSDKALQQILIDEEIQWQRRGGQKWLLQGDSNSNYFHKCANGRKRKMQVTMLEIDG